MYVTERLIDAGREDDYPRDLLEIQVLDDSTDETQGIARAVRRAAPRARASTSTTSTARTAQGFKAGALEHGLTTREGRARRGLRRRLHPRAGLPPPHGRLLHRSADRDGPDALGPPQPRRTRCSPRRRRSCSTATSSIEHTARNRSGRFFNFNGTAGIWRREAIDERRRLAARHAHRGPRPLLPRADEGLEVRLPPGPRHAGRAPGGDERVQERSSTAGRRAPSRRR